MKTYFKTPKIEMKPESNSTDIQTKKHAIKLAVHFDPFG